MPSPVFIICSEGGSIDRHTNMMSVFDVIEKITFKILEKPATGPPDLRLPGSESTGRPTALNSLRMTAVWRQSEGDSGGEFEFRTAVRMPGMTEDFVTGEGRFVFKTMLYRVISTVYTDMPSQSGEIIVRSSVRRIGDGDWLHQEYLIPVERIESSANQPNLPMSDTI